MAKDPATASPLARWKPHLAVGITGHRPTNPRFAANREAIEATLASVFDHIDRLRGETNAADPIDVRCYSLLAAGVDQIASQLALARGWSLTAPLPFGRHLYTAIGAQPGTAKELDALLAGRPAADPAVEARAAEKRALIEQADLFEIADRDEDALALLRGAIEGQHAPEQRAKLDALVSENVALAGRIMVERCDLLIAVWDHERADQPGGTGHTVMAALGNGTPVLLIDPVSPANWSILTRPEEIGHLTMADAPGGGLERLRETLASALAPGEDASKAIARERWRPKSTFGFGIYRRIEGLFGGRTARSGTLQVHYEAPDDIVSGSASSLMQTAQELLEDDPRFLARLRDDLLPAFAWADGVSSRLADAYRSGMTVNFALSAFAIIAGIAYLPFDLASHKWIFALVELLLLLFIVITTYAGSKRAWHSRWFATRRVAEYLRFAPVLAIIGVARPVGRWPRGEADDWPERIGRDALRDAGLPRVKVDRAHLRRVLEEAVLPFVQKQREYHEAKSAQLARAHYRIDRAAELCFLAAVVSVSIYLAVELAAWLSLLPKDFPYAIAKAFTFMGVAFPTLGANLAGIRYFGDFERFSAISSVTSGKLEAVEERLRLLLTGDPNQLTYRAASVLVAAVDEVVVSEIENWQSVFSGKHLALPA